MRIAYVQTLLLLVSLPAIAELGGQAMNPTTLRSVAKAVRQASPSAYYTTQEIETEDGTTIREYLLPSGEVFAVVWTGPTMPNLRNLFGLSNFQAYLDEMQTRPPGRRPVHIDRSDLVVQSGGHSRAYQGRAYLPRWIPAGVSTDEIK
jgi:hypothetical protein